MTQTGLSLVSRDLATARSQGKSEASAAAAALGKLGLGAGTVVYLDLESYSMTDTNCSTVTVAFTSEWTKELHQRGYLSGVYGGAGSLMRDLTKAIQQRDPSFQPPDHIWVAHWNQLQTTRDTYSPQYYPDYYWTNHQRLHQYSGDTQETWGGVSLHIDRNWVDATLPGNATQTAYGANTLGPGSPGFVFTGDMRYWTPAPGKGAQQKAYSTGPSTGSEGNGATWSPTLEPGTYRVEANIPDASVATKGLYVLDSALGRTSVTLDQGTGGGYRLVGTVRVEQGRPASVHLADNGGGVSTKDPSRCHPLRPDDAADTRADPYSDPYPDPYPDPHPQTHPDTDTQLSVGGRPDGELSGPREQHRLAGLCRGWRLGRDHWSGPEHGGHRSQAGTWCAHRWTPDARPREQDRLDVMDECARHGRHHWPSPPHGGLGTQTHRSARRQVPHRVPSPRAQRGMAELGCRRADQWNDWSCVADRGGDDPARSQGLTRPAVGPVHRSLGGPPRVTQDLER